MTKEALLTSTGFLSLDIPGDEVTEVWCGGTRLKFFIDPTRADRIEVPLPGWIWRDVPLDNPARIHWFGGETRVSRRAVHERLSQLTAQPVEAWRAPELVGALEHVHYGGLADSPLAEGVLDWLRQAAALTGLCRLVSQPFVPVLAPPGQNAIAAFGTVLRRDAMDSDLAVALDRALAAALSLATDAAAHQALILAITGEFCRADCLSQLADTLKVRKLPNPGLGPVEPWNRAEALAFRLVSGDLQGACQLAEEITVSSTDWIATPVLGWVLRYPLSPSGYRLSGAVRTALIDAITRFSEARAPLACTEMIRSTLAILDGGLSTLDSDLVEAVIWRTLRAFGTSPRFWDGIAALVAAGRDVPAELIAGLQAFKLLQEGARSTDPARYSALVEASLRRLRNLGVADIERMQVELLGASETGREVNRALTEIPDGAAALLRADLAPLASGTPPHAKILLKALRRAAADIPTAPLADVQRRAMGLARALTAPDAPDAMPVAERPEGTRAKIAQLLPLYAQLAGVEGRYCGIGIGCALLADLAGNRSDRTMSALSKLVPEFLALIQNLTAAERAQMLRAPFPRSAAARLHASLEAAPQLSTLCSALPLETPDAHVTSLRRPEGIPLGPALIDTLVVVVSCRAYLDTRVAALRQGWLIDLAKMGVPHVVLVGGDETRLTGDILQVAASDSYEGLPQKILAMLDWVLAETGFAHVLKIDDDCHVDPVAWFGDGIWRQTDWYGRRLDKSFGLAERDWHQARARDEAARLSFETLPLEGVYTDGSTGYALSRAAMSSIVGQARSIDGHRLIASAFSEDRMIGALLAQTSFLPESANYHSLILRKSHPDGMEVPQWAEGVMPCDRLRHTKVVHFDGVVPITDVDTARRAQHLSPSRLWPSNRRPSTAYDNGALCFIGSPERLAIALEAKVAVVSVTRNERAILPHFLDHYRRMGVESFLIADNVSDDGALEYLAEQPDVALFSVASQFRSTNQGTDWKLALISQLRGGRWTLVADADEFLLLPPGTSLPEHVTLLPREVNAQRVLMRDMYPKGSFSQADFTKHTPFEAAPFSDDDPFLRNSIWRGPFSNGETLTSALRHRLMPAARIDAFMAQKTALVRYRPWMRFSTSLHFATEVTCAADDLVFAHFKYHAGFAEKALSEATRGQYWNNAEEYRIYCKTSFEGMLEQSV